MKALEKVDLKISKISLDSYVDAGTKGTIKTIFWLNASEKQHGINIQSYHAGGRDSSPDV